MTRNSADCLAAKEKKLCSFAHGSSHSRRLGECSNGTEKFLYSVSRSRANWQLNSLLLTMARCCRIGRATRLHRIDLSLACLLQGRQRQTVLIMRDRFHLRIAVGQSGHTNPVRARWFRVNVFFTSTVTADVLEEVTSFGMPEKMAVEASDIAVDDIQ